MSGLSQLHAEEIKKYDEVIVSASLTPVSKTAVGSAVTVITSEEIERRGTVYLSDILREVPGFAVSKNGSFGTLTDIRVRGAEANHTLVLIDGIEANDPSFTSAFRAAFLTAENIERIEILRGAQSALWGSDAIGAVINIITKKGEGPLELNAGFEAGSFDTQKSSLGASYGNSKFNINLNAEVLRTDGINIARTGSEKDGHHNRTYDFKLGFNPFDALELNYVRREVIADTDTDPQPFPSATVVDSTGNKTFIDQTYQKGSAKFSLFDDKWINHFNIESIKTQTNFLSTTFSNSFSNGNKQKYSYQSDLSFKSTTFLQTSHDLSFLLEYQDDNAIGTFIGGTSEVGFISKSYVTEYRLGVADRFFVTAGVRHDGNEFFDNADTYRVTGAYRLYETGSRIHMSYGTGVKNPTISELFGAFPTFIGNPGLTPETSKGWDVGVEQSLFNDKLSLDITYFNNAIKDQITGFVTATTTTVRNSNGTNRIEGIEYAMSLNLIDDLDISGAYTFTRADDANGNELIRRAKHIASVNANYSFINNKANINLGIIYNGEQEDTIFTSPSSRTTLGAFTVVNLSGSYKVNNMFSFYGRVENLFDESYEEVFSYRAPGIGAYAGINLTLNP